MQALAERSQHTALCRGMAELDGQLLAATTTAGGQNATAVLGGHTGTEAVHLAALTLLGLVGTEHVSTLLTFCLSGHSIPVLLTSQLYQYTCFASACQGGDSSLLLFF